ncbi:MAG: hypothetical protein JXR07_01665 [Reichenbachiella sp.]
MEALVEFGKIILPAGVVLYAMYLVVRLFLQKEYDKKLIDIKLKNIETVLPVRLQAYERICLLLERITPKNLISRLNSPDYTAEEFHHILLHEIREEFNHNISQQVYISGESWDLVKSSMEEVIMIINEASGEMTEENKSIDLSRKIFDKVLEKQQLIIDVALKFIKEEIQQSF